MTLDMFSNHNPVLNHDRIIDKSNIMDATNGSGNVYPNGAHKFPVTPNQV